jgi:oligopeptide transport system substrate-binding protein
MKKPLALLLVLIMVAAMFAGCRSEGEVKSGDFTFRSYTTSASTNWNPHTWESDADGDILRYMETPLCDMTIQDSANGLYQWVFMAATSIEDVTEDHRDDLTKYAVTLPAGKRAEDITEGYVYEIKLNPNMKWQDGTKINADTYVYSMKALLDPTMQNYRAKRYYSGEFAVAGGAAYHLSGTTVWTDCASAYRMEDLKVSDEGFYTTPDGEPVKFAVTSDIAWLRGNSLADYVATYGDAVFDMASFEALAALADGNGNAPVNAETIDLLTKVITFSPGWGETPENVADYLVCGKAYPVHAYDGTVGLYKVDEYTIIYVCQTPVERNYFLTFGTSNWLVHKGLYEAGKKKVGDLVTTNYMTGKETAMSYGPYKIASVEVGKEIVLTQNENWYDWELVDGRLISYTDFDVDGKKVQQYQTTSIQIKVLADETAVRQAFLAGQLDEWAPETGDLLTYGASDRMYKADETYTMSFFFNTNVGHLKKMDKNGGNANSIVLSNVNFRKAMSLAIDRADLVKATAGYAPAYALMNNLYFYDIYNDPASSYRCSVPAMEAMCKLYGVEYGPGKDYATLQEAYRSINGLNMAEARALMAAACKELVDAGLYKEGEKIVIHVGWAKSALTLADEAQVERLTGYINTALEGSGFGEIELIAVGNIEDRYAAVPAGEYAIGWGAWGGAAFYPFLNFKAYCDPDRYDINEAACWDPTTETLTLSWTEDDGATFTDTMTWQVWSGALTDNGKYAGASFNVKLQIAAAMEYAYLNKYYRIPMADTTVCSMLSFKCAYYTRDYNIMYGWGGLRLMTYHYNDAEWEKYVAEQGGQLKYQ